MAVSVQFRDDGNFSKEEKIMDLEHISRSLGVTPNLLILLNELPQIDWVSHLCDPDFRAKLAQELAITQCPKFIREVKFNAWCDTADPEGMSSDEIGAAVGGYTNRQEVSRLMRASGYEVRQAYFDGKQGRRWFRATFL